MRVWSLKIASICVNVILSSLPFTCATASTDTLQDGDGLKSGYLDNHNINPQLVGDTSFGNLWTTSTTGGNNEQVSRPESFTTYL